MRYSLSEFEDFDKKKSKVLKYVLYKKRTEKEVIQKFSQEYEEDVLREIIEELKENLYIDDYNYIERTMQEFYNLKNLSIKEVKYKLFAKGIDRNLVEDYESKNYEKLNEYEEKSARNIVIKKAKTMNLDELTIYLLKKGYRQESVQKALQEINQ